MVVKKRKKPPEKIIPIRQTLSCEDLRHPQEFSEVMAINSAYMLGEDHQLVNSINQIPAEWQLVTTSHQYMGEYAFKAMVYFNTTTQQLMVAIAGTDPTNIYDLIDDGSLIMGAIPMKFKAIQLFMDEILDQVSKSKVKQIIFTGHSLGAVVADLGAVEAAARGFEVAAHTYENPGSLPLINLAIKQAIFSQEISWEEVRKVEFKTTNNNHNYINTLHPGCGLTGLIIPAAWVNEEQSSPGLLHRIVNKVMGYCGIGSLSRQLKEHSLDNFIQHFSAKNTDEESNEARVEVFESWRDNVLPYDSERAKQAVEGGRYWMYNTAWVSEDDFEKVEVFRIGEPPE